MSSSRPPEDMRIPWVEEIRHRTALAAADPVAVAGPEAFMQAIGDISVLLGALDRIMNALAGIRSEPEREPAWAAPSKASVTVRAEGRNIIELEDCAIRQARQFLGDEDGTMRLAIVPGYEIGDYQYEAFTASVTVRER
jgi:hypothetical protein